MAATCPIDFDITQLRTSVRAVYTRVADDPNGEFHFHRGAEYAVRVLGYDPLELAAIPERARSRSSGAVFNPLAIGPIGRGETILDHACGAGMDLLLAARRVGRRGKAIGVDVTPTSRLVASQAASDADLGDRVEIRDGVFEELPVATASVDVVISNGVLNLSPDKRQVLREVWRVLRPGGCLYLADVVVQRELSLAARKDAERRGRHASSGTLSAAKTSWSRWRPKRACTTDASTRVSRASPTPARKPRFPADLRVSAINFSARKAG